MYFTIADPTLLCARSFDDEIVIAHFGNGNYYSLLGSAAEIWRGLMASVPVTEIAAGLAAGSNSDEAGFRASIDRFVEQLHAAGLIRQTEAATRGDWQPALPPGGWLPPQLESFSDMQELLLLDPVHDTSEAGWPYVAAA